MTWKCIYTYRERCKTGPAHNRCWKWSPFHIQAHLNAFLQILKYFPRKCRLWQLEYLGVQRLWVVRLCRVYFCTLCPSIGPQRKKSAGVVSNSLTDFWMQHCDGARLSPNSLRNAVWHALNEPVCQYLRTRNPALFDCIYRQYFGASSDRLTLYKDSVRTAL